MSDAQSILSFVIFWLEYFELYSKENGSFWVLDVEQDLENNFQPFLMRGVNSKIDINQSKNFYN